MNEIIKLNELENLSKLNVLIVNVNKLNNFNPKKVELNSIILNDTLVGVEVDGDVITFKYESKIYNVEKFLILKDLKSVDFEIKIRKYNNDDYTSYLDL